jgi:tetraprenyl-beta-curcumene synthase
MRTTARSGPPGPLVLLRALPGLLRQVEAAVGAWEARAEAIPDPELRHQARQSLRHKRFHCQGGAVYALAGGPPHPATLRFIVALQTLSDYLDNLSDRMATGGARDLAALHEAVRDAVDPTRPATSGYYRWHPRGDDGGYLPGLVAACRREVAALSPGPRAAFLREAAPLAARYARLQALKHLPAGRRERVRAWAAGLAPGLGLAWWEAAAAAGSTLGIFALFAEAAQGALDRDLARSLARAYFPWVGAWHILLDYWIDQAEDRAAGDLNFADPYPSPRAAARRLAHLGLQARRAVASLPRAALHRAVVAGLPALYLTDPKVGRLRRRALAWRILAVQGPLACGLALACAGLRRRGRLGAPRPVPTPRRPGRRALPRPG